MCDEFVMRQVEQKAKNKAGKYEGEYNVIIYNNKIAVESSDGLFKISAMSKCDPQDKFDVGEGFKVAMNRLVAKRDEIHVGDKVMVKREASFNHYADWVIKNIKNPELISRFAFGQSPNKYENYTVMAIAVHGENNNNDIPLAYIQSNGSMSFGACYLVNLDNLEKVN